MCEGIPFLKEASIFKYDVCKHGSLASNFFNQTKSKKKKFISFELFKSGIKRNLSLIYVYVYSILKFSFSDNNTFPARCKKITWNKGKNVL